MAQVVFLRGVNVGGHKSFSPAALARDMAALEVVNIGAAGTFVVPKAISQAALRSELKRRLPVDADCMICTGRELLDFMARALFRAQTTDDIKAYVSVLARRQTKPPALPICRPEGEDWQVKVIDVTGRFALSLHRRMGRTLIYPNAAVAATARLSMTRRSAIPGVTTLLGAERHVDEPPLYAEIR